MTLNRASVFYAPRGLALSAVFGLVACGVMEHPHETQALEGNDFGPIAAGATGVTAGATSVASFGGSAGAAGAPGGGSATGGALSGGAGGSAGGTGGAALSGVTINLGGVEVPKEHAIAFIHIGHSNMAGRANRPTASRPYHFQETHPHAWMYHPGSMPELAIEPKTAGDSNNAGPGTALVKEAALLAPDYYFISLGWAKSSAYCSQFVPGSLYYDQLIAGPKAIKGRVTFGGIFIYLGITERHGTDADRANFANCINTLVTAIRNDVGEPSLPLLETDYEVEATGEMAVGGEVASAIMPQIAKIPTTVASSSLVSAAGLTMQDDHHFDLDGQKLWVQRALMIMQQKGWFPWAP